MRPHYDSTGELGHDGSEFDSFSSKSIRAAFIRKVYGIISIQLIITFGAVLLFSQHKETKLWAQQNAWLMWISLILVLATLIPLVCCNLHRTFPTNFILLALFTIGESLCLAFASSTYRGDIVLYAIAITAVVVIALTFFAFQTKIDFTVLNGILFVCLIVLMMMGLLMIIFRNKIMVLVYSSCGALLFSVYLVVDTQMLIGGSHKYQISPEDYIYAAVTIYLDIINLFMYILQILNAAKD